MKKSITFLLLFYSFWGFSQTTQQLVEINTFIENNKCDEAEQVLLKLDYANSTNKSLPLVLKNLALCISESDNEKAIEIAQKALELNQKQENNQPNELQARILQNIGVYFLNQNKAEEAEKYVLRSINIEENLTKFNNKILLKFYQSLANCQINLKKDVHLNNTYQKIRQIYIDNKETESEEYFESIGNMTAHFLRQKKLYEAQNILEELFPKYSASMDSINYCRLIEQLLYIHSRNDFSPTQKTIDLLKAVNFKRIENSVNKDNIGRFLVYINSKLYSDFSAYSNIITKEALDEITINNFILLPEIQSVFTKENEGYDLLTNVDVLFQFHDKDKLTDFEKQLIYNILAFKSVKLNFEPYAQCIESIAERCITLEEFDLAEKCYKKRIEIFLEGKEIDQDELYLFLKNQSDMYRRSGQFNESIVFFEQILKEFQLSGYYENEIYRILCDNYITIKNYEKFDEYLKKVIAFDEFRIKNNLKLSPLAILNNLNLSVLYRIQKRDIEAKNLVFLALKDFENIKYFWDPILEVKYKYYIYLRAIGLSKLYDEVDLEIALTKMLEREFKDCDECKKVISQGNSLFFKGSDKEKLLLDLEKLKNKQDLRSKYKIIATFQKLSAYYISSHNIEKALNYLIEGKRYTNEYPIKTILFNREIIRILRQQNKSIDSLLIDNEILIRQVYGQNSRELNNFYSEFGYYHMSKKNYVLAISFFEKSYLFFKNSKYRSNIRLDYLIYFLSLSYHLQRDFKKANEYLKLCLQEQISYYNSIQGHLNEDQFNKFIIWNYGPQNIKILSRIYKKINNNYEAELEYDVELLMKHFFLQNELYLKRLPSKINDELLKINNELSKQTLTKEQKEGLLFKKTLLDSELSNLSYSSDTIQNQSSNITWKDVQKRLKSNEVAIEFISFESNYTNYAALLLQPNNEKPIWINLRTQQQIDSLWQVSKQSDINNTINQFYNNPKLYELIWKPLEKHLVGISKIYFAPAGGLHKIAFQALTGSDGEKLSKKYNLIQLTSTRELMDKELYTINSTASFALFGGIDYDADSTQLSQNKANFINNEISYTINTRDSKKEKFSKLQFTDNEVKGIASLFNSKANQLFTGNTATEEQFKLLGSFTKASPTIIHLATHGFYFDETNVNKRSLEEQIVEGIERQSNRFKESSNPLLRSGLVMAGANHAWQGNTPYKGLEDGILTAQEIANLNLSNTKLVVLSACESGLGDIKNNNEGVYGLQRAFKMAGVEYLLVSLWSIDDFTTQKMMRLFYTNLKTGMSIEESYKSMVENIKKQYPDEPFKWASFVLIK